MERKRKLIFLSIISLAVALVLGMLAVSYHSTFFQGEESLNSPVPTSSSNNDFENAQSKCISVKLFQDSHESLEFNITQGKSMTINIAFSSLSNHQFAIPLYLSLGSFEHQRLSQLITSPPAPYPTVPLSSLNESANTPKLLEASFTENPLTLEPNENKTADLTITALKDADIGEYTMLLEMGNWEQTGLSAVTFKVIVMPSE